MEFSLDYVLHYGPQLCSEWIPRSFHQEFSRALICGVKLQPGRERELFVNTGLIHILVVSGAHLHFFDRCFWFLPRRVRTALLAGYCWLTGFGEPIVRSFARHILDSPLGRRGFTNAQKEAAASLILVILIPSWIFSRSFLMSWMCAQALNLPFKRESVWWQSTFVFLFLYAFCLSSPVTIALNALLAPLIGATLFPLCLASLAVPPISYVTDFLWNSLIYLLEWIEVERPMLFVETKWLAVLPWLTQITILLWEIQWRRRVYFLSRSS